MNKYFWVFLSMLSVLLFSFLGNAQESALAKEAMEQPNLETLIRALGGTEAIRNLALVAISVQALMFAMKTQLGQMAGKYRLGIMYVLSLVGGIIALRLEGLDLIAALTHSNSVAAYQVLLHQGYKQFIIKNE